MTDAREAVGDWLGRMVVLDLAQPLVYFGRLADVDDHYYTLEDADMIELGGVGRAGAVLEARKVGVSPVRHVLKVRASQVVSLSPLDDVVVY